LPVTASHTRAVLSLLAVTTRVPSGLNAAPHLCLMHERRNEETRDS